VVVNAGEIIVRQRGTHFHPGTGRGGTTPVARRGRGRVRHPRGRRVINIVVPDKSEARSTDD
jgi:large subunit ribosomal protein L27